MFILARGGQSYARLRFNVGPGGDLDLPVSVDYSRPFTGSDHAAWKAEYLACVERAEPLRLEKRDFSLPPESAATRDPWDDDHWWLDWPDRPAGDEQGLIEAKEASHAV